MPVGCNGDKQAEPSRSEWIQAAHYILDKRLSFEKPQLYPLNAIEIALVRGMQTEVRHIVFAGTTGVSRDFFSAGGAEGGIRRDAIVDVEASGETPSLTACIEQ
jgi:hypothetical protein